MCLRAGFMLLIVALIFSLVNAASSRSITVYAWPLTAAKPQQLVQISYDSSAKATITSKYTPPEGPFDIDERVRVGFHDKEQGGWHGIVTSAASFDPSLQHKLSLLLDSTGETYHIGFGAVQRPKEPVKEAQESKERKHKSAKAGAEEPLVVELISPAAPPSPVLNKPIKLDPRGKVADKEEEKTFLQKYWWAIAAFILIQLVMGGGKE